MLKIWEADNFRRTLAGISLAAAPLVLGLALLLHPGEGAAGLVQTAAEQPGRVEGANLLIVLSSMLFVPALVGLLRVIRGRGVVLAHVGVGLALIGVIGHAVWAGFQILLVGILQSGIQPEQLSTLAGNGPPNAGSIVILLSFLAGFLLGLIFIAASLWRSRIVPRWAAVCIALVPFFDFLPTDNKALFLIGPALAVVGFGTIGLKLLAMSDADWASGRASSADAVGAEQVGASAQPRVK